VDNTAAIERLLLERAVDLAVVEGRVHSSELAARALRRDALVLIAAPDHPLSLRGRLNLADLRGQSFLLREPGSGTRALMEAALAPVFDEIVVALELDQLEAIVRLVEAGVGLTCISETIVARQREAGTVRVLPLEGVALTRDFLLVSLRHRPFTPAMRAFATLITEQWAGAP
jgi:DNA-binding transcriptional LysR family regulator